MKEYDYLEHIYYLAQILVVIVAAWAAWRQIKFQTYFELTKFLQDPTRRKARAIAYRLIGTPLASWTTEDRIAVSEVFSSFDVVGMMAEKSLANKNFFAEFYQDALVDIRQGHAEFLKFTRANRTSRYWGYMEALYREACLYKDGTKPSLMYRSRKLRLR